MTFLMIGCSFAETPNTNAGQITMNTNNMKTWCIGRYTYQLPTTATLVGGTDKFESLFIKSTNNWILDGKTLFNISGPFAPQYTAQIMDAISNLSQNLVARNNNTIPKQDGICIINGLIKSNGQVYKHSINEHGFQFSNAPSVRVYTTAQSISRPTADFIKRTERKLSDEGVLAKLSTSNKTIRKGEKSQFSGDKLSGVEWIVEDTMKGKSGIIATWEHMGTPKNTLDQQIRLEVDTADTRNNVTTSSMAEKEAIHFYEILLNTIKKF
jgi:hypothetical protein